MLAPVVFLPSLAWSAREPSQAYSCSKCLLVNDSFRCDSDKVACSNAAQSMQQRPEKHTLQPPLLEQMLVTVQTCSITTLIEESTCESGKKPSSAASLTVLRGRDI